VAPEEPISPGTRPRNLSSLIYEETVLLDLKDHVELLLYYVKQKELARYFAPGDRTDCLTLYVTILPTEDLRVSRNTPSTRCVA
jgi:hypothetical protein